MEISKNVRLVVAILLLASLQKSEATSSHESDENEPDKNKQGSGGAIVEINLGPLGIIKAGGGGTGNRQDGTGRGSGFGGFSWGDFLSVGGGGGGFKDAQGQSGGSGGGGIFRTGGRSDQSSDASGDSSLDDFVKVQAFGAGAIQKAISNGTSSLFGGGGGGGGGLFSSRDGQAVGAGNGFGNFSLNDFMRSLGNIGASGGGGGTIVKFNDQNRRRRREIIRKLFRRQIDATAAATTTTTTTKAPPISISVTGGGSGGGGGGLLSGLGSGTGSGGFLSGVSQDEIDEILSELGFGSHLEPAVTLDPLAIDQRPKYTKNGEELTAINTRFTVLKKRIMAMEAQTAKPAK